MTRERARAVHLVVALAAWFAVVFQLVLVVKGTVILDEVDPPSLPARIYRFFAYFTIESNLLIACVSTLLVRDADRDGAGLRVARLAGLVGITVTGIVHFLLLRPLLDLHGADWLADKMLHVVVPVAALVAWAWVGPRPRFSARTAAYAVTWPVVWLTWTTAFGQVDGWVPYPFLDPEEGGWGPVIGTSVAVTVLFLLLFALCTRLDRRLPPAPR